MGEQAEAPLVSEALEAATDDLHLHLDQARSKSVPNPLLPSFQILFEPSVYG